MEKVNPVKSEQYVESKSEPEMEMELFIFIWWRAIGMMRNV